MRFSTLNLRPMRQLFRQIFIQTEATPNIDSIKFKPGKPLLESANATKEFLNQRDAMQSPLALKLFRIDGVSSVFIGYDFITITKQADMNWQLIKPQIFADIMDFCSSGMPIFKSNTDTTINEQDSETVAMIKELLDTRIRPTIQDDGGDIEYVDFVDGIVKVKLQGSRILNLGPVGLVIRPQLH